MLSESIPALLELCLEDPPSAVAIASSNSCYGVTSESLVSVDELDFDAMSYFSNGLLYPNHYFAIVKNAVKRRYSMSSQDSESPLVKEQVSPGDALIF